MKPWPKTTAGKAQPVTGGALLLGTCGRVADERPDGAVPARRIAIGALDLADGEGPGAALRSRRIKRERGDAGEQEKEKARMQGHDSTPVRMDRATE